MSMRLTSISTIRRFSSVVMVGQQEWRSWASSMMYSGKAIDFDESEFGFGLGDFSLDLLFAVVERLIPFFELHAGQAVLQVEAVDFFRFGLHSFKVFGKRRDELRFF